MIVNIWCDVEDDDFPNHYWIQIDSGKVHHYFHFDALLNWHDTDIINADSVRFHV